MHVKHHLQESESRQMLDIDRRFSLKDLLVFAGPDKAIAGMHSITTVG
jgi:hypothetical protein